MTKKVFVIGLDCAEPCLAFEKYLSEMKNLKSLMESGIWGRLKSTIPPITVPAWASMISGYDPGELGIYGFRNRVRGSYELEFALSGSIRVPRLWDIAGQNGLNSVVFAVPPTYPPPRFMKGAMVSCFLTPDSNSNYSFPPRLRDEISERFGPYIVDVENFRTEDKKSLLKRIYEMTHQHYRIVLWLIKRFDWDFFMMVDMGIDRFHHGFFKYIDPQHMKYEKGNPFEEEGVKFYRFNDEWMGRILNELPPESAVMVVSDHGAKSMRGGVCINEWLIRRGYLRLKGERPSSITTLKAEMIDWDKTRVWGEGGYYARVFLNVKGREPLGIVPEKEYESLLEELKEELEDMKDEEGGLLNNKVYHPHELYRQVKGLPPDLIVLFGNLDYRSVGSVGFNRVITAENDIGPDDANHNFDGIFVLSKGGVESKGRIDDANICDIAPTVCKLLSIDYDFEGRAKSLI